MNPLLASMFWVCLGLIFLTTVFQGIGLSVQRAFGLRVTTIKDLLTGPWVGFAATLALLQAWHLLLPVNGGALLLISALGVLGVVSNAGDVMSLATIQARTIRRLIPLLFVSTIFLAYQTTRPPGMYDSFLYHIPSIKWASSYPVVPGLGLLHDRLGFNQSYFLYAAMLNNGPFTEKYHHIASALLLFWSLATSLYAILNLLSPKANPSPWAAFSAMSCVPVIAKSVDAAYCSSPTPDTCVFLLGIVIASELISLLLGRSPETEQDNGCFGAANGNPDKIAYSVFCICFLGVIGITVKLNFAVYGGVAAGVATVAAGRLKVFGSISRWKIRFSCILFVSVLLLWMGRGVVLTGYPLFPLQYGAFPVEWKLTPRMLDETRDAIVGWARMPGDHFRDSLHNFTWIKPWAIEVLRDRSNVVMPLSLAFCGVVIVAMKRGFATMAPFAWLVLLAPVAAIVFCLVTAPDPRFAGSAFWVLGIGTLAVAFSVVNSETTLYVVIVGSTIILTSLLNPGDIVHRRLNDTGPLTARETKVMTTESGVKVVVPLDGNQVGNASLPNAPSFNPKLRLRVSGRLGSGFVLSGEQVQPVP